MNKINDWIKEQLKKGYKKEQIKESLRMSHYPQNIIDSVDSTAKIMNKKRNFNFILILFIVLIVGITLYLVYQKNSFGHETNLELEKEEDFLEGIKNAKAIVSITSDGFDPVELSVEENQGIVFVNEDVKEHTLIIKNNSENIRIRQKGVFLLTLKEKGIFEFYFEAYPEIHGKINVN